MSCVYATLHPATVGYQRDSVAATGPYAARGERPACRGVDQPGAADAAGRQGDESSVRFRFGPSPTTNPAPRYRHGSLRGERRPRVYLTLGTVSFGAVEVLSRAIAEIAPLDADILVTVGPDGEPAALGEVPDNVHVERFVAQSAVLPLVDLIVHHGGTGTVLGALEAGLPQLVLPQGADQFFNAEILTTAGFGRALPNDAQQPGAIGEAVQALLGDSPERQAAARIRDEIAAMPSPATSFRRWCELAGACGAKASASDPPSGTRSSASPGSARSRHRQDARGCR